MDLYLFLMLYVIAGCFVALILLWRDQAVDPNPVLLFGGALVWPVYVIKWVCLAVFYVVAFVWYALMMVYDDLVHSGRG